MLKQLKSYRISGHHYQMYSLFVMFRQVGNNIALTPLALEGAVVFSTA